MQNHQQSDRLSWGDTVFLHLEREGMPLNVASICMFEGEISLEGLHSVHRVKAAAASPLSQARRACAVRLGLPSWEYDPEFDLRRHVREVTLKHGTDIELKALAAKLFGTVMDRQHPLWDMTLVRGLKGNRTGIIFRLHHCLADGIAGVGIMNALLDASPEAPRLPKKNANSSSSVPSAARPIDLTHHRVRGFLFRLRQTHSLRYDRSADHGGARRRKRRNSQPAMNLPSLFPEITAFTERLRFNVIYRGPQKFACTEIPLADVKAIRHKMRYQRQRRHSRLGDRDDSPLLRTSW